MILTLSVFPILVGLQYLRSKVFSQSIKILIASIALLSMVAATVNHYHFQLVFRVKWPQTSYSRGKKLVQSRNFVQDCLSTAKC